MVGCNLNRPNRADGLLMFVLLCLRKLSYVICKQLSTCPREKAEKMGPSKRCKFTSALPENSNKRVLPFTRFLEMT